MADPLALLQRPRYPLLLTKAVLVLVAIGLCVVGRRMGGWPVVGWAMYSSRWPEIPGATIAAIELRAVAPGGTTRLTPADLYPFERIAVLESIFEHAFDSTDTEHGARDRSYLAQLIRRRLREDRELTIEGWRLEWEVEPLAVPPLHRNLPAREIRLGSFPAGNPE